MATQYLQSKFTRCVGAFHTCEGRFVMVLSFGQNSVNGSFIVMVNFIIGVGLKIT